MKSVKINTLQLTNFKGIKDFKLETNGDNLAIYGDNASGKTTLFDAFTYLLFDKDSQNQKDFDIKTIGPDGKTVSMVDHEVEAALNIDGKAVTLKKVYREQWTRKRGSASETFSGHETVYYIDDIPKKKNEYTKYIEGIIEEDIFKLLTSPTYFNEKVKWQDRRKALLRIAGEVSNDEIFKSNDKLKGLAAILQDKKIEDFRKMQAERKKKINDELTIIPSRIDENVKMLPEGSIDLEEARSRLADYDKQIDAAREQIGTIRSGNALLVKKGQVIDIQNKMSELKRTVEDDSRQEVYKLKTKIQEEEGNRRILENKQVEKMREIDLLKKDFADIEAKLDELRPKVIARKKEVYVKPESNSCDCPTCGQALPEDQVKAADEKAEAAFNLKKSEDVENMTRIGKAMKEDGVNILEQNSRNSDSLAEINAQIVAKDKSLAKLKEQLKTAENNVQDVSANKEYQELEIELAEVKADIVGLEEGAEEAIAGIQDEIAQLSIERQGLQEELSHFEGAAAIKRRIAELEEQQKRLSEEFEKIEHHIYLTEEFIRAQVRVMEERINAKFKFARFNLFEVQVNGAVNEVCETTYKGVPYSSMNNAAKINVGLDIINTLSEFHGMKAPIFVDNAEAVVELIDTDSQLISLIVSGADKTLRIEQKEAAGV